MPVDVLVPPVGESIATVIIARWLKQPGDTVAEGETLVEIDSDKATLELPAPAGGVVAEHLVPEGDEVPIGTVVTRIQEQAAQSVPAANSPQATNDSEPASSQAPVKAGPAARQLAGKQGVDLARIEGSGKRGRVTSDDVRNASAPPSSAHQAPPAAPPPAAEPEERVRMTSLRRTIARRLVEAQQTAAMLTTFNEVDMGAIIDLRTAYKELFLKQYGIKLGFMSFFVKAAIQALKENPAVNASISGDEIVYKNYWNIGVAVSTERGLMVPVLRHADRLSFAETEQGIANLAIKARDGNLLPNDFKGGTFTISNGGIFGSLLSTPILNPPQVGILGLHSIQQRPVGRDGQVVLRPMMYLALSYDHRIIDGRQAVGFLVRIKALCEAPERLLLEV